METSSLALLCGFQGLNSGRWGEFQMLWPLVRSAVTDSCSSSTKQGLTTPTFT